MNAKDKYNKFQEIKSLLPWIIFKYKCGTVNALRLEELWKPTHRKKEKVVAWAEFWRCGWLNCDCHIVDHWLEWDDDLPNALWKEKNIAKDSYGDKKDNRNANVIDSQKHMAYGE